MTCKTAGYYRIFGTVTTNSTSGVAEYIAFRINGSIILAPVAVPSVYTTSLTSTTEIYLNVGDYIELVAATNASSAGALASTPTSLNGTDFGMSYVP